MGRPSADRTNLPEKYCKTCGKRIEIRVYRSGRKETIDHFNKRLFCDKGCYGLTLRNNPEKLGTRRTHAISSSMVPAGPCANCGAPDARDVHHINKNEHDNSLENLIRLCDSCHRKEHRAIQGSCMVCGKQQIACGLCRHHYNIAYRYGDPYYVAKPDGCHHKDQSQSTQIPMALGD